MSEDQDFFTRNPQHMKLLVEGIEKQLLAPYKGARLTSAQSEDIVQKTSEKMGHILSGENSEWLHQWRVYVEKQETASHSAEVASLPDHVQKQALSIVGTIYQPAQLYSPNAETHEKLSAFVTSKYASQQPQLLQEHDTAKAAEISGMMKEVRTEAARSLPGAKMSEGDVEFYVVKDNQPNMTIMNFPSRDGKHMSTLVLITDKELEGIKDPAQFKAALGHEYAHELFKNNAQLKNDPRFQPNTPEFQTAFKEFQDELKRTPLNKHEKATADSIPDPTARNTYTQQIVQEKIEGFKEEAMADKLGLYLSKDSKAASNYLSALHTLANNMIGRDIDAIPFSEKLAVLTDPHPTFKAREAEVAATERDIQHTKEAHKSASLQQPHAGYIPTVTSAVQQSSQRM